MPKTRVAVISKLSGTASNYDCYPDLCPFVFIGHVSIYPVSFTESVGNATYCPADAELEDSNYNFVNESVRSTWN